MNWKPAGANPLGHSEAKRRRINASEFLGAFRDRSDDYYLMGKFSLKPEHLRKVYDKLIERGLLAEHEYSHREKKSSEVGEKIRSTPSPEVSPPDITSVAPCKSETSHSGLHSEPIPSPNLSIASTVVEQQAIEFCPKCDRAKHSDYPDSCPYCGVVFAKIKQV